MLLTAIAALAITICGSNGGDMCVVKTEQCLIHQSMLAKEEVEVDLVFNNCSDEAEFNDWWLE